MGGIPDHGGLLGGAGARLARAAALMIGISSEWRLGFTVQGSCLSLGFVLIAPFHEDHGLFTETV